MLSEPNRLATLNQQALDNVAQVEKAPIEKKVQVFPGYWGDVTGTCTFKHGHIYAVLNMANAYSAGGGYTGGAAAQEENMFRRTSCHFYLPLEHMDKKRNRYHPDLTDLIEGKRGLVYLDHQNIRVCVKGNETKGYPNLSMEEVIPFYELRAAADDLRVRLLSNKPFNEASMRAKIEAQFQTCIKAEIRHVVLSAFGCGAFLNPATRVASLYSEMISKHAEHFDHIVFAVYHAGYGPDNYTPFKQILDPDDKDIGIQGPPEDST